VVEPSYVERSPAAAGYLRHLRHHPPVYAVVKARDARSVLVVFSRSRLAVLEKTVAARASVSVAGPAGRR
jgi:hypothetical protein